jgi:Mg2+/Co2+ transporter CorB
LNEIPLYWLFIVFIALIMMSAHLAGKNHGGAMRALELLKNPDKLITLILLGNNFINVLITQLATYIGYRLYGEAGIAIAAGLLTLILLLFAEVTPKTLAASSPEKIALPAAYVYKPLAKIFTPVVVVINWSAKLVLKLFLLSSRGIAYRGE